jgi:signal transduction histidine kinase/CheY-like chemotaxis protein
MANRLLKNTFFIFSGILFLVIFLGSFIAYSVSARNLNRSYIEQQLSIATETIKLRLSTETSSILTLVLKLGATPVIQEYFLKPDDPSLRARALVEFELFNQYIKGETVFWVSDMDKRFYSTSNEPYDIIPDDPEFYWYNMTLHETEVYNFNINYNSNMNIIYLWVNVPVFAEIDGVKKAVGIIGTGINLTDFSYFIANAYKKFDENIIPYLFNRFNEITAAIDYELVDSKIRLDDHLGDTGKQIINAAFALSGDDAFSFVHEKTMYMVSAIPAMEWYLVVSYPLPGILALNRAMNIEFFGMLLLILILIVTMNIFEARSRAEITRQNMQLRDANRKAEAASRAKSDFLAKMSHEIRTPMNAITGMAELLLRGKLEEKPRGQVHDIKRAASNLVSIINDILDFSKIEAGMLEIVPSKYLFSSLVNDAVSIIRMRLIEKPVRFYTNIDSSIPLGLVGDEVRMRQIFLNLLSNAVKYTDQGHISVTITKEKEKEDTIWLKINVADTGHGIKPEDKAKLFGDFIQVDVKKSNIEGTGLGLAITKRLCDAMGGSINMESEYGKGSSFTVIIPQKICDKEHFAAVQNPENKKVLVYERRLVYANSIKWSLDNMKVPNAVVTDEDAFKEALNRKDWNYVFSGHGLYDKIKPVMENIPSEKRPSLALLVEWGTEAYIPNVRFVSIPVQSLSIANVLNGRPDNKDYFEDPVGFIRFTIPKAKILVVDDIDINLLVVEGILSPYLANVETCLSGEKAIELVKQKEYDIIFMDHMMPGMDGIEATKIIRDWEEQNNKKHVPIVALTANAVSGMREVFIENGFSDFLAKPIDIAKLDEVIDKWISLDKRE